MHTVAEEKGVGPVYSIYRAEDREQREYMPVQATATYILDGETHMVFKLFEEPDLFWGWEIIRYLIETGDAVGILSQNFQKSQGTIECELWGGRVSLFENGALDVVVDAHTTWDGKYNG